MANPNPQLDREEALQHPIIIYQWKDVLIRMGPEKEGPQKSGFRYVIIDSGVNREVWQGYLYKED